MAKKRYRAALEQVDRNRLYGLEEAIQLLVGFAAVHAGLTRRDLTARLAPLPDWAFAIAYGASVALVVPWMVGEYRPFIYFQF